MEDEKLKELMMHGEYSTTADFTNNVMQRLEAPATVWQNVMTNQKLPKAIAVAFAVLCLVLIITGMFIQPVELPPSKNLDWVASHSWEVIYFLLLFWSVLLANQWWYKKNPISYKV